MTYHRLFDSWTDYLGAANRPQIQYVSDHSRKVYHPTNREPWNGFHTWGEALEHATNGWTEGVAQIKKLAEPLVASLASAVRRPEIVYQDQPALDYDLGLVMMGEPEHWMAFSPSEEYMTGTKEFTVCVNLAVSA